MASTMSSSGPARAKPPSGCVRVRGPRALGRGRTRSRKACQLRPSSAWPARSRGARPPAPRRVSRAQQRASGSPLSQPRRKPAMKASPAPSTLNTSTAEARRGEGVLQRRSEWRPRKPCSRLARFADQEGGGPFANRREGGARSSVPPAIRISSSEPTTRSHSGNTVLQGRADLAVGDETVLAAVARRPGPRGPADSRCRRPRGRPPSRASRAAFRLAARTPGAERCVPLSTTAAACAMKAGSMSPSAERHVGAILAKEDQREVGLVADAEHRQSGQTVPDPRHAADIDALARRASRE